MAFVSTQAVLPAQTAGGATSVTQVAVVPSSFAQQSFGVAKLSLTSPTLVTGQATNFATVNFRQVRAGSVLGTIGSYVLSSSGVTLAAETEQNVAVTGSPVLLAGDVIDVQLVQTGTGLALPAGIVAKVEID